MRRGQQGTVILHALVDDRGNPVELRVVDSSGFEVLDEAALASVRRWEFEPAVRGGRQVAAWVRVPVAFVLQTR